MNKYMKFSCNFFKAEPDRFLSYSFFCGALVLPGLTYIYHYQNELFLHGDILRIVFLSIIYSFPLLFINFIISLITSIEIEKTINYQKVILFGSSFSFVSFYSSFTLPFFLSLDSNYFLILLFFTQGSSFVFSICTFFKFYNTHCKDAT